MADSSDVYVVDEASLPVILPASVARVTDAGLPTKATIDNEFTTREWYKRNAIATNTRITELSDQTDENFAGVYEDIETVTDAQSATATALQTVTTTVGQNTATIQTLSQSVNGLGVKWALVANINGTTGSLEFVGYQRADGLGPIYAFTVNANMVVNGNLMVNGTISTPKVADEAINTPYISEGSGPSDVGATPGGTWTDMAVVTTASTPSGYVTLSFRIDCSLVVTTGGASTILMRVYCDQTGAEVFPRVSPGAGADPDTQTTTAYLVDQTGGAARTYRLQVLNALTSGVGRLLKVRYRKLSAEVRKK